MMQKLRIDTVLQWAKAYKVDGFRFDLMNLHTVANATAVKNAVQALTEGSDGVDGSQIYVYGEGWDFGSAKNKGLTHANQYNLAGTGIGTFNDKIRDAAHSGFNTDSLQIRHQGFINGLSYDWNGYLAGAAPATLGLEVWGGTLFAETPDHHLVVEFANTTIADVTFDGLETQNISEVLPEGLLQEGSNSLQLKLPHDLGLKWDVVGVEEYRVTYPRAFVAADGRLTFELPLLGGNEGGILR